MPRILLAGVIVLALLISGCKIGGHNSSSASANVRLLNLVALSGNVTSISMTVNGVQELSGQNFETISSYAQYSSGNADTVVISTSDNSQTLSTSTETFNANINYTLIAYGSNGQPGVALVDESDNTLSLNSGYFQIHPINLAINAGVLDYYLVSISTGSCASGATSPNLAQSAVATFPGLTLAGVPAYLQFPSGCYAVYATQTGTKTVVYQSNPYTFNAGDVITFLLFSSGSALLPNGYVMNQISGTPTVLVPSVKSQFKLTNASTTAGAVTVQLNGVTAFPSVPFATSSTYVSAPAGTDSLTLTNSTGGAVGSVTPVFAGGGDYSTVVIGNAPNAQVLILPDNNLSPVAGDMKIRFVNAGTNAGALDIQVSSVTVQQGLAPTAASPYFPYLQNALPGYNITATQAGTNTIVLSTATGEVVAGATYTCYILGNAGSLQAVIVRDN